MRTIDRLARKFSELREECHDNDAAVLYALKEFVDFEFDKFQRDIYYEGNARPLTPYRIGRIL